ncbi:MAG: LPP20 family lipoprotein [Spirochaetales bacterium]|nr:LPP20 family lipoprotein [Spirochaetales bacterium]
MKKTLFIVQTVLLASLAFAKPKAPEWMADVNAVYPQNEYIAMMGTGDTAENAKSEAVGSISRYFSSKVKVNTEASKSFKETNGEIQSNSTLNNTVQIESEMEVFGIEYANPYFAKKEKKWYTVAYINKSKAWTQLKPELDFQKNEFNRLYKKLVNEEDSFIRLRALKKVNGSAEILLRKLEYARIMNAAGELSYGPERDRIAELESIEMDAKSNCSIFMAVNGTDYKKTVETSVASVFSSNGLNVSKSKAQANYVAEINIDNNENGTDPISIKPSINIKVLNRSGKTVFSYDVISEEKALGYTLDSAQKKLYPELSTKIQTALSKELDAE